MSWTDGKPHQVTDADVVLPWSGAKDGRNFRCHLCGHFFEAGDWFVFVHANGGGHSFRGGNFLACATADGPAHGDVAAMLAEAQRLWELVCQGPYWWALPSQQRPPRPGAKRDGRADRWDD